MAPLTGTGATTFALALSLVLTSITSAQVPAGPEFRIGAYPSGQWSPRVSMEPDGDFVVVWSSRLQDGSGNGVFGQRFAASGTPVSAAFQVNTYTTGDQGDPDVSVGSRGDFVVAWARIVGDYGESVHARRYDVSGNAIGDEFQVSTSTASTLAFDSGPHVGRASDGRFVISWVGSDDYGAGILARRYAASGDALSGEFVLNPTMTNAEDSGDIAVEDNGSFVAVWQSYADGIHGQRYDAAGSRRGSEFRVNSNTTTPQLRPRIGVSRGGAFVVVWTGVGNGNQLDVFARRFDATGAAVGNDFLVNSSTANDQTAHQVTHDGQGNFIVTWQTWGAPNQVFGQRYTANGARRGSEFRISAAPLYQGMPSVASDGVGNLVVTWVGFPLGGPAGIFGQRFGGLQPAALAVDPARNGVLEAGETLDVRPAWRNITGATQTFSSALTGITGPAGVHD